MLGFYFGVISICIRWIACTVARTPFVVKVRTSNYKVICRCPHVVICKANLTKLVNFVFLHWQRVTSETVRNNN